MNKQELIEKYTTRLGFSRKELIEDLKNIKDKKYFVFASFEDKKNAETAAFLIEGKVVEVEQ